MVSDIYLEGTPQEYTFSSIGNVEIAILGHPRILLPGKRVLASSRVRSDGLQA